MAGPTFDAAREESFYAGGPMQRLPTRLEGLADVADGLAYRYGA
jgi:hypothetical protein